MSRDLSGATRIRPRGPRATRRGGPAGILCGLLLFAVACGHATRTKLDRPLFSDSASISVSTEAPVLSGPSSNRPNRFFQGWRPFRDHGRNALQEAPGGSTILITTLEARPRKLVLDLVPGNEAPGQPQVRVAVDDAPSFLLPLADPLSIPLDANLAPGRHVLRLTPSPGERTSLVVQNSRISPSAKTGGARLSHQDLLIAGPAMVEVVQEAKRGWVLEGEACPDKLFASLAGASIGLEDAGGHRLGQWVGRGGLLGRLQSCRRVAFPPISGDSLVRVRFLLTRAGSGLRLQGWRWRQPLKGPGSGVQRNRTKIVAPPRASPPPRLVVVYVMDALRADFVGCLGGDPRATPTIDRLAGEGFLFRNHHSTAPNTLLSTRNLFTGRILVNTRAWKTGGEDLPMLAEAFQTAGYHTGLFSGNGYVSAHFGLARGFDHVSRKALFQGLNAAGVNRNAERVQAAALKWLRTLPSGEPAFLYIQTIHPHNPYAPPRDLGSRFTAGIPSTISGTTAILKDIERSRRDVTPADRERLRGLYTAALAYNDRELGLFLAQLKTVFPEREILVALTADHGEELFDHGGVLHGYTLFEELLHIPLVVWAPGIVHPGETSEFTDSLDLNATLLSLLGRSGPGASEGRNLMGLMQDSTRSLPEGFHFSSSEGTPGGIFAVRFGPWKYIWVRGTARSWSMGLGPGRSWQREYFFDLSGDGEEKKNLASSLTVRKEWLRLHLRSWAESELARLSKQGKLSKPERPLDEEELKRLRALGYVE